MKNTLKKVYRQTVGLVHMGMNFPTYSVQTRRNILKTGDPVRYASFALALERIKKEKIPGSLAEVGVYQGDTSRFIHDILPDHQLHLFDTFQGFPDKDTDVPDERFRDTNIANVVSTIGSQKNIHIHAGYFPETARGLADERFSFVLLDLDLFKPTLAGLEFFYPRLAPGGYCFLHDFNSPESNHAISRAISEYMADKPEMLVEIPDRWGSAVFRKNRLL